MKGQKRQSAQHTLPAPGPLCCVDTDNLLLHYRSSQWIIQSMPLISARACFSFLDLPHLTPLPVLSERTSLSSLRVSSSSWEGSRGSCVCVRGSSLPKRADPPQWCHCGEEKWQPVSPDWNVIIFLSFICKEYSLNTYYLFTISVINYAWIFIMYHNTHCHMLFWVMSFLFHFSLCICLRA